MHPDGGGLHLSSRDAQSVFETILPAWPVAVRQLYRDACALRRGQSSSAWRRASSTFRECQSVHHGAINKHCYARHYFRISAGMSPCLISMPLVAMARTTSTTTMLYVAGRKVKLHVGYPQSPSCQVGHIPLRGQRLLRCGIAR